MSGRGERSRAGLQGAGRGAWAGLGAGLLGLREEGLGAGTPGSEAGGAGGLDPGSEGGGPGTWMPVSESGGDQEPRLLSPDSVWHLYPEDRRLSKAGQGLQDLGAPAKVVMVS